MRLFDFQFAYEGNPAIDLAHFLCSSCSKEVLCDIKRFLGIYYESLSVTLREFGCNPAEIVTLGNIESFLKEHLKFGLFMIMLFMHFILGESEQTIDLEEIAESGQDLIQGMAKSTPKDDKETTKRISEVIITLLDQGYL